MPYNEQLGNQISSQFRTVCTTRMTQQERSLFEGLLQVLFAVPNRRNVELWTRFGTQQRRFIRPGLGEQELDLRVYLATKLIAFAQPNFPVKVKCFLLPADDEDAQKIFQWLNDNWLREYTTRMFMQDRFFCIEYAADSDAEVDNVDIDSDEFDDVVED